MGLMHTEAIQVHAEAYDVALDISFPRGEGPTPANSISWTHFVVFFSCACTYVHKYVLIYIHTATGVLYYRMPCTCIRVYMYVRMCVCICTYTFGVCYFVHVSCSEVLCDVV